VQGLSSGISRTRGMRPNERLVGCLLLIGSMACSMKAQVYEVQGGESSLYQASGGKLNITAPNYDVAIGAGTYAGHFMSGARLELRLREGALVAGDDHLDFRLPTDLFDGPHYLYTRGLSIRKKIGGTDALLFGGVDLATFSNPLFPGGKAASPLGFLSLHSQVASHWQLSSETVVSNKQSEILALQWKASPSVRTALAGGIGSNAPYGAASLDIKKEWIDLKSSYVQAGTGFHRFAISNPTFAEPIKGNVSLTMSPTRFLSVNGSIQNYLVAIDETGQEASSSSSEAGVDLHFAKAALAGTLYQSKYLGQVDHAGSGGLRWSLARRAHFTSMFLASRPRGEKGSSSLLSSLDETLSTRLTISQSVSFSSGTPTLYFGGSLQSNFLSVVANYETFYVPSRTSNPFETALVLDISFRIFGRFGLHGQTNLGPTGRLLYSADAYGMAYRGESARPSNEVTSLGKSILRIQAMDTRGVPVEGAALLVDQHLTYTDSMGRMFIREHRPRTHPLTVALNQFLNYGEYELVSAPKTVSSSTDDAVPAAVVIVRRASTGANHMSPSDKQ
jgi:hypothetical protein